MSHDVCDVQAMFPAAMKEVADNIIEITFDATHPAAMGAACRLVCMMAQTQQKARCVKGLRPFTASNLQACVGLCIASGSVCAGGASGRRLVLKANLFVLISGT